MRISSYTNIGKRENNEDFIAISDFVFTLCDGVGGVAKGEVASKWVAESFIQKIQGLNRSSFSVEGTQKIIAEIQDELNKSLIDNPEYAGMGTTLCTVLVAPNEVLLAHIGDSRIYVVKTRERKYWRSTDHSTVAELLQSGIITDEEALHHSRRNQITRAIQAIPEQEASQADISILTGIEPCDLIFMCSDGVMEALRDAELVDLLCNTTFEPDKKLELIKLRCLTDSSDNHSAILIEFEPDDQITSLAQDQLNWIYLPANNDSTMGNKPVKSMDEENVDIKLKSNKIHNIIKIALYVVAILLIAFLTLTMLKK